MKKLRNNIGMTMAEMLIVVAIIVILCGVAFIAVWNYQRSMGQLERDGIAKEIFVAAQNHLTAAYGEGYLGHTETGYFGTEDFITTDEKGREIAGDYYYIVNGGTPSAGVFEQMLPFGSVDETVRVGGSYIIHYQKDTGLVLDVFYCTRNGSPTRFNVSSLEPGDYSLAMNARARESKGDRRSGAWRNVSNGPILGYYGGTDAASLPTVTLQPPKITVHNEEKLYVEVNDTNKSVTYASLKLIITGVSSKAQKAYKLEFPVSGERVKTNDMGSNYTVILDDITSKDMHFGEISADTTEKFIPGENIEIQAVAFSTAALANIAYSSKITTNSLFGSINSEADTAYIGNIRHLENLDKAVSNLDHVGTEKKNKINISKAEQTDSFSWDTFQKEIINIETYKPRDTEPDGDYLQEIYKYNSSTPSTTKGHYLPIAPDYALTYGGKSHSISDVSVDITGDAGLFGATPTSSPTWEIEDLELIDFDIKGTLSAGALAGTLSNKNCTVTNVLARNSTNASANSITATTGPAGGLIGNMSGTVQYSAAAVVVNGSTDAGGLIGTAGGTITGCCTGGHTQSGSYEEWVKNNVHPYDVTGATGATAGGLVGTFSGTTIKNSYSTCSVSGTTVGGFAGSAGGSIENCYATGLVSGSTAQFAFLGSGNAALSGNYYYRGINEVPSTNPNAKEGDTEPMLPVSGYELNAANLAKIQPIDLNADSYNIFVGLWDSWNPARAYDAALVQYYSGSYTLRSVDELNPTVPSGYEDWNQLFVKTHYGDWPSPEVFFINN